MKYILGTLIFLPNLIIATCNAQEVQSESSTFPKVSKSSREQWAPHLGLIAGLATPEGQFDTTSEVGLDIGFQPYIPFGIATEVTYLDSDGDDSSLRKTQVLIKGTYNFGGTTPVIKNSFAGIGLGGSFRGSERYIVSSPVLGFDIPLENKTRNFMSLGAHAKYAIVEGSQPDVFSVSGVMKYWF